MCAKLVAFLMAILQSFLGLFGLTAISEKELNEYQQSIISYQETIDQNEKDIKTLNGKVGDLKIEIADKNDEIADLRSKLATAISEHAECAEKIANLRDGNQKLSEQILDCVADNDGLKSKLEAKEEEIIFLNKKLDAKDAELSSICEQIEEYHVLLETANDENTELKIEYQKLNENYISLCDKYTADTDELQKKYDDLLGQYKKSLNDIEELNSIVKNDVLEIDRLWQRLDECGTQIEELNCELDELRNEINDKNNYISELESKIELLEKNVEDYKSDDNYEMLTMAEVFKMYYYFGSDAANDVIREILSNIDLSVVPVKYQSNIGEIIFGMDGNYLKVYNGPTDRYYTMPFNQFGDYVRTSYDGLTIMVTEDDYDMLSEKYRIYDGLEHGVVDVNYIYTKDTMGDVEMESMLYWLETQYNLILSNSTLDYPVLADFTEESYTTLHSVSGMVAFGYDPRDGRVYFFSKNAELEINSVSVAGFEAWYNSGIISVGLTEQNNNERDLVLGN